MAQRKLYVEETSEIIYTPSEIVEDTSSYEDVTAEEILDGDIAGIENSEYYEACAHWDEQEDGSYVCDDEYSSYHGQNFFDGLMYATIGAMVASSFYKSKNKINGTKRNEYTGGSSGGGYYGGSSSSSSKGTSGATTNSSSTQVLLQRQQSQITQGQINRLMVQQTIVAASLALVLVVARAVVHHHHKEGALNGKRLYEA